MRRACVSSDSAQVTTSIKNQTPVDTAAPSTLTSFKAREHSHLSHPSHSAQAHSTCKNTGNKPGADEEREIDIHSDM
jgi:hypothetical protein